MQQLGYGDLDKKDVDILKEVLDIDGDGNITTKDFKELFNYILKRKYLWMCIFRCVTTMFYFREFDCFGML